MTGQLVWQRSRRSILAEYHRQAVQRQVEQAKYVGSADSRYDSHGWAQNLPHSRLPDIDEALVRRFTWSRAGPLRDTVQDHLRRG